MPQHITVVDSDPSWPRKYAAERDRIAPALGDNLLAVWHIGSTAVPGLAAKPVIDIMAAVRSLEAADAAAERFAALGENRRGLRLIRLQGRQQESRSYERERRQKRQRVAQLQCEIQRPPSHSILCREDRFKTQARNFSRRSRPSLMFSMLVA